LVDCSQKLLALAAPLVASNGNINCTNADTDTDTEKRKIRFR
jgi:hypothetical protein